MSLPTMVLITCAIYAAILGGAAFLLTLLFGRIALPILRAKKAGQPINEYVHAHQSKAGTPTMGGIAFVPAFLATMLGLVLFTVTLGAKKGETLIPIALVSLYALANAAIGFVDDYFKLLRRHNEGLTEKQKFILQVVAAAAFLAMMAITGNLTTELHIPFTDIRWELSWFAYPIYLIVMVGFVNATNITDGLDGLASSICATVAGFIVVTGVFAFVETLDDRDIYTGVMGAALLGCVLGFLVYNHHPAKMFMGDTGSLFLGAVIMGCGILAGELLLFVLAGFMFVIEMLSSLLQRVYYKLTHGKRIFKMAPLHHHFEKCNWSEVEIVTVFTVVSAVFCILAFLGAL